MNDSSSQREPVEELAEEYLARFRRGERPTLSEYIARHPQHAAAIRELFPVLMTLEGARPESPDAPGGANARSPFSAAQPPARLGDYRIIREIGRGGMGLVYEAEQETLGRRVALKVLPLHAAMAGVAVERFRREAQAAARLHHTNIVPVFDVGQEGPTCFYAMQYIHGQPLDRVIAELRALRREGPPGDRPASSPLGSVTHSLLAGHFGQQTRPHADLLATDERLTEQTHASGSTPPWQKAAVAKGLGELPASVSVVCSEFNFSAMDNRPFFQCVARIGCQVADALAYAHSRGIIHRDIKPSNLLLDTSGVAWVTDFGMVKVDGESLTHSGDILGTLRYMAPERFHGDCDSRADIYALGLTLYELLALQPAFDAPDRFQLIEMISAHTPRPLRQLNAKLPRDLETIVLKAMDKDPERRYPSAEALGADLRRFAEDRPILARRVIWTERLASWARRNPVVSGLSLALAVILLTVATVSTLAAIKFQRMALAERTATARARAAGRLATLNLARAETHAEQADRRAAELRRQDYVNRVNLAYLESRHDNVARSRELLEGCPPELRGWEWSFVRSQNEVALQSWREEGASVNAVALHPDGSRLAVGMGNFLNRRGEPGSLLVRNVTSGQIEFARHQLAHGVAAVAYSPDGSKLAVGHGTELQVWDMATGQERFTQNRPQTIVALAFSPDGQTIAAGYGTLNRADKGYAVLYQVDNGAPLGEPLPGHAGGVWSLAFDPGGQRLALASEGVVEVWDLPSRSSLKRLTDEAGFLYAVAWHPEGRWLAAGGLNRKIRLWDATTGELARTFTGHTAIVRALAFSPDGQRLVSASEDKSLRLWTLESEDEETVFRGHTHFVNSVSFGRDGYVVASGGLDRTVKVWFAAPQQQLAYRGHVNQGHVRRLAFSPRGNAVVTGSYFFAGGRDRVRVWDPHTGQELVRFPSQIGETGAVAFHPNGLRIATGHPDGAVALWDATTCHLTARLEGGHIGAIWDLAFSDEGTRLASAGQDGAVNLWDLRENRLERSVFAHLENVRAVDWAPDGRRIASASDDGSVKIWDAATGIKIRTLAEHEGAVWGVAFSPDGRNLASVGGIDHHHGEVRIWETASGALVHPLRGHTDVVFDVDYSPDGTRLATASDDRTIKLWDTETGDEVFTLRGHTGGVICVAFSPDGRQIGSGSVDRTARVWSIEPADAVLRYQRQAALDLAAADEALSARRPSDAITHLDRARRFGLDGPRVHFPRLMATLQVEPHEANNTSELAELVALASSNSNVPQTIELAMSLSRAGQHPLAISTIERAQTLDPQDALGWSAAGRLHAAAGHQADAANAFTRSRELHRKATEVAGEPSAAVFATGWWLAGPFTTDLDQVEWPESAPGPFEPPGAERTAVEGWVGHGPWFAIEPEGDGYLNFAPYAPDATRVSVYATQWLYSPAEQTVAVLLGAEGAVRLWLERDRVFDQPRPTAARRAAEAVPVTLKAGWNRLLVKVSHERGQPGAYVHVSRRATDLARAQMDRGELAAVVETWTHAPTSERRELHLMTLAAEACARQGRWRDAAEIYRQLVERQPVRNRNWVLLAPLLVQAGDASAYRRHCDALLAAFADASLPITLERTAKACLLLPGEPPQARRPLELATRAGTLGSNHDFLAHFRLAEGMAQFRAGQLIAACELLEQARTLDHNRDPYLAATAGFFLAMACHQRQLTPAAEQYFAEAMTTVSQQLPSAGQADLGPAWSDWLICEIARTEAATMLAQPAESAVEQSRIRPAGPTQPVDEPAINPNASDAAMSSRGR